MKIRKHQERARKHYSQANEVGSERENVVGACSRTLQVGLHFLWGEKESRKTLICKTLSEAKRICLWAVCDLLGGKRVGTKLIWDGKSIWKLNVVDSFTDSLRNSQQCFLVTWVGGMLLRPPQRTTPVTAEHMAVST